MFTQCPNCDTVFRVTVDALRVAAGEVRCGVCAASFNALDFLSEQAFEAEADGANREPAFKVVELAETESIELSTSVDLPQLMESESIVVEEMPPEEASVLSDQQLFDEILQRTDQPAPEFRVEPDEGLDGEIILSAEYPADLEPLEDGQLDLEAALRSAQQDQSAAHEPEDDSEWEDEWEEDWPTDPPADDPADERELNDLDSTDEFPILVLDELDEMLPDLEAAIAAEEASRAAFEQPRILIPSEMREGLLGEGATSTERAEETFSAPIEEPAPRRWGWMALLALLLLLLAGQVVHSQRETLLQDPTLGPWLLRAYELTGQPQAVPMDLAAFELRQWGATNAPEQAGRLRLRASIVNRAQFAQPFPLLRVSLQDRFGTTIGSREVAPADYLPGERATQLLASGQRVDAEITIVDPGTEAVGFEIDVCLPDGGLIRCSSDPDQQR